eukprot:g1841.t1
MKRKSILVSTSAGANFLAPIPMKPMPEDPMNESPKIEKKKRSAKLKRRSQSDNTKLASHELEKTTHRLEEFRRYCSSGDLIARFTFGMIIKKKSSSPKRDISRKSSLQFLVKDGKDETKVLYISESSTGDSEDSWHWKSGVLRLKPVGSRSLVIEIVEEGSHKDGARVPLMQTIAISLGDLGPSSQYRSQLIPLVFASEIRPGDGDCKPRRRSARASSSITAHLVVKSWFVTEIGSPGRRSEATIFAARMRDKQRRHTLVDLPSPGSIWRRLTSPMFSAASPSHDRRRGFRHAAEEAAAAAREVSGFATKCSDSSVTGGGRVPEVSSFKPSPVKVEIGDFFTLTEFQDRLRKATSKEEYCTLISNAQMFFTKNVPLHIIALDSASVMVKELKRQRVHLVRANGTSRMLSEHVSISDRMEAVSHFCTILRKTIRSDISNPLLVRVAHSVSNVANLRSYRTTSHDSGISCDFDDSRCLSVDETDELTMYRAFETETGSGIGSATSSSRDVLRKLERLCSFKSDRAITNSNRKGIESDVPVIMWIWQNLGENRIGKQIFDAMQVMLGIDLQKSFDFMLFDMKGNSKVPEEIAEIRINATSVEVEKINHLQLSNNTEDTPNYDINFHVKSVCRLNLETMHEDLVVLVCYDADKPCRFTYDPESQRMISLHSMPIPFDASAFDHKYTELCSLFVQRMKRSKPSRSDDDGGGRMQRDVRSGFFRLS